MDASAGEAVTARPDLPAIGDRVGIRYGKNGPWLPFTVKAITPKALHGHSPIFGRGSSFCFSLTGDTPADPRDWSWQPWDECPVLRERCGTCKGMGEVMSKKKGETYRTCSKCKGAGEVARDDPFEAPH